MAMGIDRIELEVNCIKWLKMYSDQKGSTFCLFFICSNLYIVYLYIIYILYI